MKGQGIPSERERMSLTLESSSKTPAESIFFRHERFREFAPNSSLRVRQRNFSSSSVDAKVHPLGAKLCFAKRIKTRQKYESEAPPLPQTFNRNTRIARPLLVLVSGERLRVAVEGKIHSVSGWAKHVAAARLGRDRVSGDV
jgi:hypothetical protein